MKTKSSLAIMAMVRKPLPPCTMVRKNRAKYDRKRDGKYRAND